MSDLRGHNNPPIDPERLVDVESLPALLAREYQNLSIRGESLIEIAEDWLAAHPDGKILDEADAARAADIWHTVSRWAGTTDPATGEVEAARKRVKDNLTAAGRAVDGWFGKLRERHREVLAQIGAAQTSFLQAQQEAARTLEQTLAGEAAPAPRVVSAMGTQVGQRSSWKHEVTDLMDLVRAVAAGQAPLDFLTTQTSVINASIRAGRRACPGLRIWEEKSARMSAR